MTMEALTQPRHIKVSGRFYLRSSLTATRATCWLAPFQRFRWTQQAGPLAGQPAHPPCNGSREGSTS